MRKYLTMIFPLLLVTAGTASGDTPMQRIMAELEEGKITETQAAEYLVAGVVDPEKLPLRFTVDTDPEPCGTPAMMEAARLFGDAPLASRPSLSGSEHITDSPSGHFKIHWTNSGNDATTAAYANNIASAADSSWTVQCDELGFFHPPPDNNVGGDNKYDIYIKKLSDGTLGYTTTYGEYRPPDSTHRCSASHIVIKNGISNTGTRLSTVAHEFQHAVQMSYDYQEPVWFMENCAVWMEEIVYPDYDDYHGYISYGYNALRTPWKDIRSPAMYWYGGFPWPWMMWDRWGTESVRKVWENCAATSGSNMLDAQEKMFNDHGKTFESVFMDYGVWRWFTAGNWYSDCGMYNPEAAEWTPGPRILPHHKVKTLPASGDQTSDFMPETYGIHWIRVELKNYQDQWIKMSFNGRDGLAWNLGVIMQDTTGGRHYYKMYRCDSSTGDVEVTVGASGWDYAIFFPACMSSSSIDHLYTYNITATGTGIEGSPDMTDLLNLRVSSNPIDRDGSITFNMPETGRAELQVYDTGGRAVATLLDDDLPAGSHTVAFEGTNLANGTYFVMLFAGDGSASLKVVVAR